MTETKVTRLAIDLNGGGAEGWITTAAEVSIKRADLHVFLVGDVEKTAPMLDQLHYNPCRITLVHALKGDRMAPLLLSEHRAEVLLSSRHVNALKEWARSHLTPLAIDLAPAFASASENGGASLLILDVGASHSANVQQLVEFAVMGEVYAALVHDKPKPRVAILSANGQRGTLSPVIQDAQRRLDGSSMSWVGLLNGSQLRQDRADVLVTDGHTGQIVLELLEQLSALGKSESRRDRWAARARRDDVREAEVGRVSVLLGYDALLFQVVDRGDPSARLRAIDSGVRASLTALTRITAEKLHIFREHRDV